MTTQMLSVPSSGCALPGSDHTPGVVEQQSHEQRRASHGGLATEPAGALGEDIERRLEALDDEIDALQTMLAEGTRPWYQDAAVVVSVLTFLLSLATTLFAYVQADWQRREQRIVADRVELRELVQRLTALPRENAALSQVYTDTLVVGQLSGLIQAENALLAKQATQIIARIPEHVTVAEYATVAGALSLSGLMEQSLQLYVEAEHHIQDANDAVTVYYGQGFLLFNLGRISEGRVFYQRALDVFQHYPVSSIAYRARTHAQTELFWAHAEMNQLQCEEAARHLREAEHHLAVVPNLSPSDPIAQQIVQSRPLVERCGKSAAAAGSGIALP